MADVQVISPGSGGEVLSWNWDNHTRQMAGLMGGLGLVAVVVSVTLQYDQENKFKLFVKVRSVVTHY